MDTTPFYTALNRYGRVPTTFSHFQDLIWSYYHHHRRPFAWRDEVSPYRVFISEVMLQQTQTDRVVPKFELFMTTFPTIQDLAAASFESVLKVWSGLGYNRRARFLWLAAQEIVNKHGGIVPQNSSQLQELPGIGLHTAGSIAAFAYDLPTTFLETNIKAVLIHYFFKDQETVSDKELLPLANAVLDISAPREWYYALMDHGVMLKKTVINPTRKSSSYTKQSKFEGSVRQVRGAILRTLLTTPGLTAEQLHTTINRDSTVITKVLEQLVAEQLITRAAEKFFIAQ
jgi:A/G-specific adenine glycosylase